MTWTYQCARCKVVADADLREIPKDWMLLGITKETNALSMTICDSCAELFENVVDKWLQDVVIQEVVTE